jgi:hypothetical protein
MARKARITSSSSRIAICKQRGERDIASRVTALCEGHRSHPEAGEAKSAAVAGRTIGRHRRSGQDELAGLVG